MRFIIINCDVFSFQLFLLGIFKVFYGFKLPRNKSMGGDLGGPGDGLPKNLRWWDGPWIRPPNIWRSSVKGCAGKVYER